MEIVSLFLDAAGGCRGQCVMLDTAPPDEHELMLRLHDEFVGWLGAGTAEGFANAVGEIAVATAHHVASSYPSAGVIDEFIGLHNWPDPVAAERLGYYLRQLYDNARAVQWSIDQARVDQGWGLVHPQGDNTPYPLASMQHRLDDHERRIAALEAALLEFQQEASR